MAIPKFVRVSDYPFGINDADHSNALFLGLQLDEDRPEHRGRRVDPKTAVVNPSHQRFYQYVLCLNTSKGIMAYDVSHGCFTITGSHCWLVRFSISCSVVKGAVLSHREAILALPEIEFTDEIAQLLGGYRRPVEAK